MKKSISGGLINSRNKHFGIKLVLAGGLSAALLLLADPGEKTFADNDKIAELEAKDRVNTYRDKLIAAGFDNDTAILMAQALPAGVSDDYFTAVKAHNDIQRQGIETATLKNQPGQSVGMPPTAADAQKEEMNRLRKSFGLKPLA